MRDAIVILARKGDYRHLIKYLLPTVLKGPRLNDLGIQRTREKGL